MVTCSRAGCGGTWLAASSTASTQLVNSLRERRRAAPRTSANSAWAPSSSRNTASRRAPAASRAIGAARPVVCSSARRSTSQAASGRGEPKRARAAATSATRGARAAALWRPGCRGAQAFNVAPVAQALAAQPGFQRQAAGRVAPGRHVLEGVEHVVAAGVPGQGAQQGHQLRGNTGGGELPAVFIANGHTPRTQQRAHAPGKRAVGGSQGHGHAASLDVRQHPGRGAFGFVFRVHRREKAHLAARRIRR
jgi:hypothetical protein